MDWQSKQPDFLERASRAGKAAGGNYWRGRKRPDFCGVNNPKWKGGTYKGRYGMIYVQTDDGYDLAHRVAAGKVKDRTLLDREVVHHIDGRKQNNETSNLFLFRHQAAHMRWHHFLRRHALDGKLLVSNL